MDFNMDLSLGNSLKRPIRSGYFYGRVLLGPKSQHPPGRSLFSIKEGIYSIKRLKRCIKRVAVRLGNAKVWDILPKLHKKGTILTWN